MVLPDQAIQSIPHDEETERTPVTCTADLPAAAASQSNTDACKYTYVVDRRGKGKTWQRAHGSDKDLCHALGYHKTRGRDRD